MCVNSILVWRKSLYNRKISQNIATFAIGLRQLYPRHFRKLRSVMLILWIGNVGNFTITHKDSIVVLTHIAWAAITTFVCKVFPTTSNSECGIAVPRSSYLITLSWERWESNFFISLWKKIIVLFFCVYLAWSFLQLVAMIMMTIKMVA